MNVQCELCPKVCVIGPGQSGDCRIRVNMDGVLCATTYGYPSAVHIDPIEKKPFNHFLPGTTILSIATVGCNLHCKNCQNWDLSQRNPEDAVASPAPPKNIVRLAGQYGCPSVAYTYSDPIAYYEYTLDCCRLAREAGLKNALVSAGYINEPPWRELCRTVDAATIDLKALSDAFYRDICRATLKPVLNALVVAKSMGVLVEVSNLVIPTLNDSDEMLRALSCWIRENMGRETPLHFLGFHPEYQMRHLPPTPGSTLARAREIALAAGLDYVYTGNVLVKDAANTYCPSCRRLVVARSGYQILKNDVADGRCPVCKKEIYGRWQ
jgi:pyruvate formate lyase activating enzyme